VARLVTRNNSIHRRKTQNKPFDDLLPDSLKSGTVTTSRIAVSNDSADSSVSIALAAAEVGEHGPEN
jgi:hypothetical protein